jgi:hypothetical protein
MSAEVAQSSPQRIIFSTALSRFCKTERQMEDYGTDCRVVVTGMGVVAAIGQNVADFWKSLKQTRSGIAPLEGVPLENLKVRIAAQVRNFDHTARLKDWRREQTILHSDRYS